jgi:hypothetical protein
MRSPLPNPSPKGEGLRSFCILNQFVNHVNEYNQYSILPTYRPNIPPRPWERGPGGEVDAERERGPGGEVDAEREWARGSGRKNWERGLSWSGKKVIKYNFKITLLTMTLNFSNFINSISL